MTDGYSVKSLHGGRSNASLKVEAKPYREGAFLLVRKQAVIAETHAAKRTIKLLTMENLIPALATFYSSIDQLKHQTFISTRNEPVLPLETFHRDTDARAAIDEQTERHEPISCWQFHPEMKNRKPARLLAALSTPCRADLTRTRVS